MEESVDKHPGMGPVHSLPQIPGWRVVPIFRRVFVRGESAKPPLRWLIETGVKMGLLVTPEVPSSSSGGGSDQVE